MPSHMYDRVCETTTTTGTGTLTLAGAIAGYRTFDEAGVSSSFTVYYLIEAVDANGVANGDWETGIGLLATPTTLQRLVVLDSSNASLAVNLTTGTKRVHLTAAAYQLQCLGYRATRGTNLTSQNFTTATAIAWTSSDFDTTVPNSGLVGAFHDTVTNNSRITLPTGFDMARCRFTGQVALQNLTASEWVELKFRVDGNSSTIYGRCTFATPSTTPTYQLVSPIIELSAAQYVEMMIQVQTDTSIDLMAANSFFQIEVLQ